MSHDDFNTSKGSPDPADNPYAVSGLAERTQESGPRSKPGAIATFLSLVAGIIIAVPVFAVTFFFTCLGLSSTQLLNKGGGPALLILISATTAIVALILVTRGLLKLIEIFKNT